MSTVSLWYMRDNHTFARLPSDVEAAMSMLRDGFYRDLGTYGMLCTKDGPMKSKCEHARKDWSEFEPRARKWLEAALEPTDADLEYASWFAKEHA